jgi:cyd operon protein YbgT
MWYFSWVLGLGLACAFGILNAMWFELKEIERQKKLSPQEQENLDDDHCHCSLKKDFI